MKKLITLFSLFICCISSIAQINSFSGIHWTGLSKDLNCSCSSSELNLSKLNRSIKTHLEQDSTTITYSSSIDNFLDIYNGNKEKKGNNLIGFIACDSLGITINLYKYDFEMQKVQAKLEGYGDCQQIKILSLQLVDSLNSGIVTPNTNLELDNSLYEHQIEYFYEYYLNNLDIRIPNDTIIIADAEVENNTVDQMASAVMYTIENYQITGRSASLRHWRLEYKTKDHLRSKLGNLLAQVEKSYPNLIELMETIAVYEDFKRTSDPEQKEKNRNYLQIKIRNLRKISNNENFTRQEQKEYLPRINHDRVCQDIFRSIELLYRCDTALNKANEHYENQNYRDALSIYYEILSNKEINYWIRLAINDPEQKEVACVELKEVAYDRTKEIVGKFQKDYWYNLEKGRNFSKLKNPNCGMAKKHYEEAYKMNKKLSLFPSKSIGECEIKKIEFIEKRKLQEDEKENQREKIERVRAKDKAVAIFSSYFDVPVNKDELARKSITTEIIRGTLVWQMNTIEEDKFKGWLYETNYRLGSYDSKYDAIVRERLVASIRQIISELPDSTIKEIKLSFRGSADRTAFGKKGKVKIKEKEYQKLETTVCKCHPESCYDFQDLLNSKAKDLVDMGTVNDSNQNLLLAFLRALRKKSIVENGLISIDTYIPLTYFLCGKVSKKKGEEFRNVDIKVEVLFFEEKSK